MLIHICIYIYKHIHVLIVQIISTITSNVDLYGIWQIACATLGVTDPFSFSKRLCLVSPSPDNAQLLALVFSLYHSSHNSFKNDVVSPFPRAVQKNLVQAARAYRQHIL